jgi:hypothetical protein
VEKLPVRAKVFVSKDKSCLTEMFVLMVAIYLGENQTDPCRIVPTIFTIYGSAKAYS